jgi:hypothetical protein
MLILGLEDELRTVILRGAGLLNVQFPEDFIHQLVHECFNNVYIVQETCRQVCLRSGVTHTQPTTVRVGEGIDVRSAVESVVAQQTGRYMSFITQFSAGFQTTSLEMYKWLVYPVLTATPEQLEKGFTYRDLREAIQARHPSGEGLNPGNLTQALQSVASLQVKKDITPIILDYDQTNLRLNIVDRGFIIWLNHQNRNDLLKTAGLPTGDSDASTTLKFD